MISKITQSEIDRNAVAALGDWPGAPGRYGTGGLSAGQLKAHFDKLALLAIDKLNELIDALHGAGQGDPLIDEMTTHAVSLADDRENMPLSDWIGQVESLLGLDGTGGLPARIAALEALRVPGETPAAVALSGYHPDLVAGLAENLCGRENDETGAYFTHRPTREAGDVGRGNAVLRSLHGNTLAWNQMVGALTPASQNGLTVTFSGGVLTVTGTANANTNLKLIDGDDFQSGHKYLIAGVPAGGSQSTYLGYFSTAGTAILSDQVISYNGHGSYNLRVVGGATADVTCIPQVYDLTRMFGAGREPTEAEFKKLFPLPYYAYDAGRLLHFAGEGLVTTGLNAYRNGGAEVLSGRQYQITGAYTALDLNGTAVTPDENGLFTPDGNGTLTVTGGDETTCVHLTHSGWRNGEYEPYWTRTLPLPVETYFPTGMKSAGTAYDELTAKKAITRIGSVDLSTLTWTFDTTYGYFETQVTGMALPPDASTKGNMISVKYENRLPSGFSATDPNGMVLAYTGYLRVKTTGQSDAPTGTLYYELETPTETDVKLDLTYRADDFGTEKLLPENGAAPTTSPLTGRIMYPLNAVDTVRNLPRNYISLSTFDKLRTALAGDYTIARTYNATTNDYDVTVTRVGGVWKHAVSIKNSDDEWLWLDAVTGSAAAVAYNDGESKFTGLADGTYAAYSEDHGAGTAVVSGGVMTFHYGSSDKVWNGAQQVRDAVTKLY